VEASAVALASEPTALAPLPLAVALAPQLKEPSPVGVAGTVVVVPSVV
jgi:hypothetical protein